MRVFLGGGCVALLLVIAAFLAEPPGAGRGRGGDPWFLVLVAGGGLAALGFILGGAMAFSARITDAGYADLRDGTRSIDWRYTPQAWAAFMDMQEAQARKTVSTVLVFVLPIAAIPAVAAGWMAAPSYLAGLRNAGAVIAAAGAVFFGLRIASMAVAARRLARRRGDARVVIGPTAAYAGGTIAQWGRAGVVLRQVRILSVDPILLELVTGLPGTPSKYNQPSTLLIPVPAGKEGEAAQWMRGLGFPWEPAASGRGG